MKVILIQITETLKLLLTTMATDTNYEGMTQEELDAMFGPDYDSADMEVYLLMGVNPQRKGKHLSPYNMMSVITTVDYIRNVMGYDKIPTTKEFCMNLIHTHVENTLGVKVSHGFIYDSSELILSSTIYGIVCEHLGLIEETNKTMLDYVARRSGKVLYVPPYNGEDDCDNVFVKDYITFRDLLKTLDAINEIDGLFASGSLKCMNPTSQVASDNQDEPDSQNSPEMEMCPDTQTTSVGVPSQ